MTGIMCSWSTVWAPQFLCFDFAYWHFLWPLELWNLDVSPRSTGGNAPSASASAGWDESLDALLLDRSHRSLDWTGAVADALLAGRTGGVDVAVIAHYVTTLRCENVWNTPTHRSEQIHELAWLQPLELQLWCIERLGIETCGKIRSMLRERFCREEHSIQKCLSRWQLASFRVWQGNSLPKHTSRGSSWGTGNMLWRLKRTRTFQWCEHAHR